MQLDDAPGDLRRHRDDIGAHGGVARPRSTHIDSPHRPTEQRGKRHRRQGDQDWNYSHATPDGLAAFRLNGPARVALIVGLAALRCDFSNGHDELSVR